jgi:hypothetical protein
MMEVAPVEQVSTMIRTTGIFYENGGKFIGGDETVGSDFGALGAKATLERAYCWDDVAADGF